MKLLFLSTKQGLGQLDSSAYTHRIHQLRIALQRQGVEVDYIGLRDFPFNRPVLVQPLNYPLLRKQMAQYDFIHAAQDAGYIAGLWRPFTRATILLDNHGDTFSEMQLECIFNKDSRSAYWLVQAILINAVGYRRADHHLIVSEPMRQWLLDEWHIPPQRITMIRNGVDQAMFRPISETSSKPFVVCYAGGFDPWQGVENLVKAFELFPDLPARLKIIGFSARHQDLKADIARRLKDRVDLIDRVSREELLTHLADAHVLSIPRSDHPAVRVALPTKFAEYLAMGKPVIVSDVDETADIVRMQRCGLVSKPNPASIAEQIRAAAQLTSAELREMGERGQTFAHQEFTWDVIAEKYLKLLDELKQPESVRTYA